MQTETNTTLKAQLKAANAHIAYLEGRVKAADALADDVEGYFSDADWYEGLSPEESVVFYRATATAETEGE